VLSNIAFGVSGIASCLVASRKAGTLAALSAAFGTAQLVLSASSAYYHVDPNDIGLAVDRLAMSLVFGVGFLLMAHIRKCNIVVTPTFAAAWLLLCVLGTASWMITGDLRGYAFGQYVPTVAMLLFMMLYKSKTQGVWKAQTSDALLWAGLAIVLLSKVPEGFDERVFYATKQSISGHTIKHIMAGAGLAIIHAHLYSLKQLS
jgi:hypothetical protein